MLPDYAFDIETLLNESQPRSILVVGSAGIKLVGNYVEQKRILRAPCRVTEISGDDLPAKLEQAGRHDVGIVVNTLERLDKKSAGRLLAKLRDLYTARFCVIVPIGDNDPRQASYWAPTDFYGYGMTLVNSYKEEDAVLHMYRYDIATYKRTPDWLNPSNWANPELWDKYRW